LPLQRPAHHLFLHAAKFGKTENAVQHIGWVESIGRKHLPAR
jgi:hypothetical protein